MQNASFAKAFSTLRFTAINFSGEYRIPCAVELSTMLLQPALYTVLYVTHRCYLHIIIIFCLTIFIYYSRRGVLRGYKHSEVWGLDSAWLPWIYHIRFSKLLEYNISTDHYLIDLFWMVRLLSDSHIVWYFNFNVKEHFERTTSSHLKVVI